MIKLPVYFHTEESKRMSDLNMGFDFDECFLRDIYVSKIDVVIPRSDGTLLVLVGVNEFVTPCSLDDVLDAMEEDRVVDALVTYTPKEN